MSQGKDAEAKLYATSLIIANCISSLSSAISVPALTFNVYRERMGKVKEDLERLLTELNKEAA